MKHYLFYKPGLIQLRLNIFDFHSANLLKYQKKSKVAANKTVKFLLLADKLVKAIAKLKESL